MTGQPMVPLFLHVSDPPLAPPRSLPNICLLIDTVASSAKYERIEKHDNSRAIQLLSDVSPWPWVASPC